MYREFFGLTTLPFNNTPDPRFFFNTPDHEEALASLLYAVEARKGFVLVTGEVGSGKTLLSRLLLNRLPANVRTAVITNTNLSGPELLTAICREFDIETEAGASAAEMTVVLEQFLLEQYSKERLAVVILDEAQNLPNDSLEQLRMLGNLEADDAKLLQVLILGQPELQESFRQPAMQQTFQRIFRTFHLQGLNREMTAAYIAHRLKVAGLDMDRQVFDGEAIQTIYDYAQGIPRLINQVCDNAMLAAYGESCSEISAQFIREVVEQMMTLAAPLSHMFGGDKKDSSADADECGPTNSASQGTNPGGPSRSVRAEDISPKHLSDLTNRLAAMEKSLESGDQDSSSPESLQSLQYEALKMVRNLVINTQDTDRQMRDILNRTQWTALAAEECAAADARLGDEHRRLFEERNERLMRESEALVQEQQSRFTLEADRRMRELLDKARQSARAVEESAQADIESSRQQNAATQEQTESLMNEMRSLARSEHSKFAQTAEQQMKLLLEQARHTSQATKERTAADAEDTRRRNAQMQAHIRGLVDEVQELAGNHRLELAAVVAQQQAGLETVEELRAETIELNEKTAGFQAECERRVRKTAERAETSCEKLQAQAISATSETRLATQQFQAHAKEMLAEAKARGEASQARAAELLAQQRADSEAARRNIDQFTSVLSGRAAEAERENKAILDNVRTEAGSILDKLRSFHDRTQVKAQQLSQQAEGLVNVMQSKVETSHREIDEIVAAAEHEVKTACASLQTVRNQTLAEGENSRKQTNEAFDQTKSLLSETRSHCTELLSRLRNEVTEQTARARATWQTSAREGSETLNELTTRLTDARAKAEDARSELESLIQGAHRELTDTRSALESGIRTQKDEVAGLAEDAHRIMTELTLAARQAETARGGLQESIRTVQGDATDCQAQFRLESETIQQELMELIEQNRSVLEDTRTDIKRIGADFEAILSEAKARADAVRDESESAATDLAERMKRTRDGATETVAEAEQTTELIRQQSERSLDEVRSCLSQMNERSDILRRDLLHIGEDIRETATTATKQVQDTGERVAKELESLCETARREADANHDRLSALQHQVQQSAEGMRQNAGELLDQVQTGTSSLRQHADQMLAQAQSGSERLNESAASMLTQAQTASEHFRERAEQLLHQAETTAREVGHDIREFRSQVKAESQQVEQQAAAIKHDIAEGLQDAARMRNGTAEARKEAQAAAEQLLNRAEAVQQQSEALLLSMPRELVDEAKQQAGALAKMSTKISTVVHQLSRAGETARKHKDELLGANVAADEKLALLKQHTKRVGQLVGIIRQLYGAMDARIARLRGRLIKADDLVKSVPQEIEILRNAFESSDRLDAARGGIQPPVPINSTQDAIAQDPHRLPTMGAAPARTASIVRAASSGAAGDPASTLGQIVQRNQKLNDWLRDMVGEESLAESALKTAGKDRGQQPVQIKA